MEGTVEFLSLKDAAIVLFAAGLVVPVFYRLRVSAVIGYMVIGMLVGPFGLGALVDYAPWLGYVTIAGHSGIHGVAELGVILLMFMIGLELSLERIMTMKRMIFGFGLLQVVLTAGILVGVFTALGVSIQASIVLGLGLAMSSTAIIIQVLAEKRLITTGVGRTTFAVLLFQDVAVVPVLFVVGLLASRGASDISGEQFAVGFLEAFVAVAAMIFLGRRILRPLFRMVAATRSAEMFMASCLLVVMTASLITWFVGLSLAMGALLAGLLLAETEYRRQIEVSIEPFKGLMLGIFLISIGLSANIGLIVERPLAVLGGVAGLIALKAAIVTAIGWLFRVPLATALRSGLLLGPGSEFTFVILSLALGYRLVAPDVGQYVLLLTVLTMALIPVLEWLGRRIADTATRRPDLPPEAQVQMPRDETPQVLIAGFGRVGQMVASLLDAHDIPYTAVDSDPDLVAYLRRQGRPVYYGDMTQVDFLRHCAIESATALVVTMGDPQSVEALVALARSERPDLLIVARARDPHQAARLYRAGATDAVPETLEASLQLGETVLTDLGVPMGRVIVSVHERRAALRAEIQSLAPDIAVRRHTARRRPDPFETVGE